MDEPRKILVVDDEDAARSLLCTIIRKLGHEVDSAEDGLTAYEKVQQNQYDVILTDIRMPGIDGNQLLRLVKEINNKTELIMITGYASVETAIGALKSGAFDYITKPFKIFTLERVLHNVFRKIDLEEEIKQKNMEIQESERLLRMITNSISDIIYVEDNKGDIIYVSPSLEKITGWSREELNGNFANVLTDNKINSLYYRQAKKVLNDGEADLFICEIKNKKKRKQMLEVKFTALYEQGENIATQAVVRDVTEKVKLEKKLQKYTEDLEDLVLKRTEELQKSEKQYREFVDNAIEGVFQCTESGKILLVNRSLIKMLGYERAGELYRKNIFEVFFKNPDEINRLKSFLDVEGKGRGFEISVKAKNGEDVIMDLSVQKKRIGNGAGFLYEGFLQDVTERKKYEAKIYQMDKLSSLGKLAAGVAHEIKNPLTGIKMMSHMLLYEEKFKDRYVEMVQDIYNESLKIEKIVNEMLSFSKQKNISLEFHDLKGIIDSCLVFIEKSFSKQNITINTEYADNLVPVYVDFRKIEQVLINILLNAMDAMTEGGTILIKAFSEKDDYMKSDDGSTITSEKNVIMISDNGCGIPRERLNKIFDPFFSTKPHGTGLGLSIAYQILQTHKCSIDVESEEEKGTTFIIKFPPY